jgi:hypothetical protein
MLNSLRIQSVLASTATSIVVALCAGCAESPERDPIIDISGAEAGGIPMAAGGGATGSVGGPGGTMGTGGNASDASTGAQVTDASTGREAGSVDAGGTTGTKDGSAADASGDAGGAAGTKDGSSDPADSATPAVGCEVAPITDAMRGSYANMKEAYYVKYASANGIIVATGKDVDDEAVVRYCRLMVELTWNEKVRQAVLADKMWFTMISDKEQLSSLPQINKAYGTSLNARARGLGGLTPTICAEDSIMCMPGDLWKGDCICAHETGHTLYSSGIAKVPELSKRLTAITNAARSSGRLANAYIWMDGVESGMMSWGSQVWYDCAINGTKGAYHSDINTRAELQKEMPDFYQFLSEIMPADRQYKDCYSK